MKNKIELWWEKLYPHIFGAVIVVLLSLVGFSPMKSSGINNLIDGIVMLDSIIIGFIGAVIPVVLSMKNESKFVKYVLRMTERVYSSGIYQRLFAMVWRM